MSFKVFFNSCTNVSGTDGIYWHTKSSISNFDQKTLLYLKSFCWNIWRSRNYLPLFHFSAFSKSQYHVRFCNICKHFWSLLYCIVLVIYESALGSYPRHPDFHKKTISFCCWNKFQLSQWFKNFIKPEVILNTSNNSVNGELVLSNNSELKKKSLGLQIFIGFK